MRYATVSTTLTLRQPSTKEKEPWKDLLFYTTIDLTTRFWMLPKDSSL